MIPVTKPFLPPKEEYEKYLDDIWQRQWLTNNGPLVNDLELRLKRYLNLKHLLFVGNGTIAMQIGLKTLGIKGEVITTPFSYVATTSSVVWEGCTPVFVDIDKNTLNIDPDKIESAITNQTTAILATHCFGNPCDVETIGQIAHKHGLKVIYDAAHSFGTTYKKRTIFEWGDVSTTSFHATKLFHTIEGGAIVTQSPELLRQAALHRNFGHDGPEKFSSLGINGKNSEFHAAMGLCNLTYIDKILQSRKEQAQIYDKLLADLDCYRPTVVHNGKSNFSYYPIVLPNEEITIRMKQTLERHEIFPRRYFYPSLSSLPYVVAQSTPIADSVSTRVLCLPMYYELTYLEQQLIARLLLRCQNFPER